METLETKIKLRMAQESKALCNQSDGDVDQIKR